MKRIISITILGFWFYPLFSQMYVPIITENQDVEFNVCHPLFDGTSNETYSYLGDTIINSIEYKVIGDNWFQGYLRQNSSNSKAWFKENDSSEKLIMDLDMEIGDSIFIDCEMYGQRFSKAVKIDTINSMKVIELDYIYPQILSSPTDTIKYRPLKFIEGIGTNGFIFYQIDDTEFHLYGFLLETVFKDTNKVYENLEDCTFPVSTKDLELLPIQIFPNPTSNFINIVNNKKINIVSLNIFDIYGKRIFTKYNIDYDERIDVQSFNRGLYFLQIQIGDQNLTERIIVN